MNDQLNRLSEIIRAAVNCAERELKWSIGQLERVEASGFHPECLAIIRLEADARVLRQLAERIENKRAELIGRHLEAAE